ncbi:MAG: hypothetical protein LUF87_01855 [Alistipes sp.]|nr:hypothetical protein [Alistipes sp.]
MTVEILRYGSGAKMNEIVPVKKTLTPINDCVYTYLHSKSGEREYYGVVLRIKEVYFQEGVYDKERLINHPDVGGRGLEIINNYIPYVKEKAMQHKHISNMEIEVFIRLKEEISLLTESRYISSNMAKEKKMEDAQTKQLSRLKAEKDEEIRLQRVHDELMSGKPIPQVDFLSLCKKRKIPIHCRTAGVLRSEVLYVAKAGISFIRRSGKRKPNFNGIQKLLQTYLKDVGNNVN